KIKSAAAAAQKLLADVFVLKFGGKLEAGQSWRSHFDDRRADSIAVADENSSFQHAFGGEVLAERSPRQSSAGELLRPEFVVLRGIGVGCFVGADRRGRKGQPGGRHRDWWFAT